MTWALAGEYLVTWFHSRGWSFLPTVVRAAAPGRRRACFLSTTESATESSSSTYGEPRSRASHLLAAARDRAERTCCLPDRVEAALRGSEPNPRRDTRSRHRHQDSNRQRARQNHFPAARCASPAR